MHMHIDYALLPAIYAKKCTPICILKSPGFMRIFTPSFPSSFLFSFKKVHTLAGHYKCGQCLQKVHTYMYTLKQQAAAGSIYKKVYTYICI